MLAVCFPVRNFPQELGSYWHTAEGNVNFLIRTINVVGQSLLARAPLSRRRALTCVHHLPTCLCRPQGPDVCVCRCLPLGWSFCSWRSFLLPGGSGWAGAWLVLVSLPIVSTFAPSSCFQCGASALPSAVPVNCRVLSPSGSLSPESSDSRVFCQMPDSRKGSRLTARGHSDTSYAFPACPPVSPPPTPTSELPGDSSS